MEKKALGRGLEALIPKKKALPPQKEYTYIDIDKLRPSLYQSRIDVEEDELKELADSIKSKGIIQPLIVRKKEGGDSYEIVAGSRRYYASKLLGINKLPAIIRELEDKDTLIFSIIENLQRQDLNPIEEAQGFKRLIEEFGVSYEEVGGILGRDRSTIANFLRLLSLPEVIQTALRQGKITSSQGRTLLGLESQREQLELFQKLLQEKVSVRQLEESVRRKKTKRKPQDPYVKEAEEILQKALGRKVRIVPQGRRGRLVVEYYSQDDLESLIRDLTSTRKVASRE